MPSFQGLLDWPDCRNVRDLGGYPTAGGRRIRAGALVRADSLDRLNDEGIQAVRRYGVSRILDLRSLAETDRTSHPFVNDPTYRCIPFVDAVRDRERDPTSEHTLADLYRGSINRNHRQVAALVSGIVSAPAGGVVVHCHSGADRTGMLVALVLDYLGVDRSAIAEDYVRTHDCLRSEAPAAALFDGARTARAETIVQTLGHVDDRFGGAANYLLAGGVDERDLHALRGRLVS